MPGLRALVLLVTAIGLALGLATTTVYDRPVAAPELEAICVSAVVDTAQAVATAVTDAVAAGPASGALVIALVAAALGVCFAIVLAGLRLAVLVRGAPADGDGRPAQTVRASAPRVSARPLLLTLSVIRI
jgi:hypothetical protein